MKKLNFILLVGTLAVLGAIFVAADHIEAPGVDGTTADITDFYAFQGNNTDNIVFAINTQGLMSPIQTASAVFDESLLFEINIDTDGDAVEDLIIQAIPRDGRMYFFGPTPAASNTGATSTVQVDAPVTIVDITGADETAISASNNGITAFAGPRDDPFFMDFSRFSEIVFAGTETAFREPGIDTFAGTNVMSVVIEVPKSMIGGTGSINTWAETKRN